MEANPQKGVPLKTVEARERHAPHFTVTPCISQHSSQQNIQTSKPILVHSLQAYGQHMGLAGGSMGQDAFGYAANGLNQGNMMDALQAQFAGLGMGGGRRESMGGPRHANTNSSGQQNGDS